MGGAFDVTGYWRSKLDKKLSEYKQSRTEIKKEKLALITANQEARDYRTAQKILQRIAQKIQQSAHKQISSIVTKCLKVIFREDAYSFSIQFEQKRGKTEANLTLTKNGYEFNPKEDVGGSVLDVVSFALRLSAIVMMQPKARKLIILDEPFKFLDQSKRHLVGEMMEYLSSELEVQFVLITHIEELKIGKVVEL